MNRDMCFDRFVRHGCGIQCQRLPLSRPPSRRHRDQLRRESKRGVPRNLKMVIKLTRTLSPGTYGRGVFLDPLVHSSFHQPWKLGSARVIDGLPRALLAASRGQSQGMAPRFHRGGGSGSLPTQANDCPEELLCAKFNAPFADVHESSRCGRSCLFAAGVLTNTVQGYGWQTQSAALGERTGQANVG